MSGKSETPTSSSPARWTQHIIKYKIVAILLTTFTGKINSQHPLEAELLALQKGISLCHSLDISSIHIEGDCLILISTIQNTAILSCDMIALWRKSLEMLTSLSVWSIHYCKWSANKVADCLAKVEYPAVTVLGVFLPPRIQDLFMEEQSKAEADTRAFYHNPSHQNVTSARCCLSEEDSDSSVQEPAPWRRDVDQTRRWLGWGGLRDNWKILKISCWQLMFVFCVFGGCGPSWPLTNFPLLPPFSLLSFYPLLNIIFSLWQKKILLWNFYPVILM